MATVMHPSPVPPVAAVARILSRFDRPQLTGFIEIAIDLLDMVDGDPDIETNGDEADQSYPEAAGPRGHVITGRASAFEDAEDDDPGEIDDQDYGHDEGEPDFKRRKRLGSGPGCPISDPGGCEHDGREESY